MRRRWVFPGVALAALLALAAAWRFTPLSELLTAEHVRIWARAVREAPLAPVALILAYTPAAFLMFPRPVLTLLAVLAFGRVLGFAYAMMGILLSGLVAFYAGRLLRMETVKRYAGRHLDPVAAALRRHGILAVFTLRVVPTAPHAVASALAGALRIRPWHFAVGTFLGMLPGVITATIFGGEIAAALEDSSKVSYGLAGAALVIVVATVWFLRWWLRKQSDRESRA